VRQKSSRGAAKLLNLSPSVVSYHLTQLEKRFGTSLLYRSTRKISLTHEGEILYQHAADMLSCAQQGLSKISSVSPEPSGRLTVALPSVITRAPINRQIARFC
jgi:DNA-binding transcriptional LysR family regulator